MNLYALWPNARGAGGSNFFVLQTVAETEEMARENAARFATDNGLNAIDWSSHFHVGCMVAVVIGPMPPNGWTSIGVSERN